MAILRQVWLLLALLAAPGVALAQTSAELDGVAAHFETVAEGLDQPVFLTAPAGDPRLFVVEQSGRIRIIADGAVAEAPFLDVSDLVSTGGERGLLGLAFHPDYASNGRFFVNYTDNRGDTQVVGYTVSSDANAADPASASTILSVEQPAANHNGGWLAFGPDGYLYIGMGDGGGANDGFKNGQNLDALLGKILRIDVDGAAPYAIPPDNPFANGGGAPEIFVYGVRNPWRNAFDGNDFYIADVGQGRLEEVNVITTADAGANLGWNIMEGDKCFQAASCEQSGLVLPIHVYSHSAGCSITGGYVYRGAAIPELDGRYFFGDYCSGAIYALRYADGAASDVVNLGQQFKFKRVGSITSFGLDAAGELYVMTSEGKLLKLVAG